MPYQRFARYASIALLLLWVLLYFFPDRITTWIVPIGHGLAVVVLLAFALNLGFMVRDILRKRLFVVQNLSLYVGLLSIPFMAWYGYREWTDTGSFFSGPEWWLIPLVLFQLSQNIFLVGLDDVGLYLRPGLNKAVSVPLFELTEVRVKEDFIEARGSRGEQFVLKRSSFFSWQWKDLKARFTPLER